LPVRLAVRFPLAFRAANMNVIHTLKLVKTLIKINN
jgi:hypothetical protein